MLGDQQMPVVFCSRGGCPVKAALCPSGWGTEMKLLHSGVPRDHTRGRSLSPENHYVGLIELSFNPASFFLLTSPRLLILYYCCSPLPLSLPTCSHTLRGSLRGSLSPLLLLRESYTPSYLRSHVDLCVLLAFSEQEWQ